MSALDRALGDLIAGRWVLTLEDHPDEPGRPQVVAYRPPGWTGPGDPHERLVADDHAGMKELLTRRHETPTTTSDSYPH